MEICILHLDLIKNDKKNKNLEVLYLAILSLFLAQENTMWIEEKGQQCEFCNVLGSEDLYVAGCFKIECNGCYIHGKIC